MQYKALWSSLLILLTLQSNAQQGIGRAGIGFKSAAPAPPAGATWNILDKSATVNLYSGALRIRQTTGAWGSGRIITSYAIDTQKRYMEMVYDTSVSANMLLGAADSVAPLSNYCGVDTNGVAYYGQIGWVISNGGAVNFFPTFANGDIIGMAINGATRKVWWRKNGTWLSGNPETGTSPGASIPFMSSKRIFVMTSMQGISSGLANFGATTFSSPAPVGYKGFTP